MIEWRFCLIPLIFFILGVIIFLIKFLYQTDKKLKNKEWLCFGNKKLRDKIFHYYKFSALSRGVYVANASDVAAITVYANIEYGTYTIETYVVYSEIVDTWKKDRLLDTISECFINKSNELKEKYNTVHIDEGSIYCSTRQYDIKEKKEGWVCKRCNGSIFKVEVWGNNGEVIDKDCNLKFDNSYEKRFTCVECGAMTTTKDMFEIATWEGD